MLQSPSSPKDCSVSCHWDLGEGVSGGLYKGPGVTPPAEEGTIRGVAK